MFHVSRSRVLNIQLTKQGLPVPVLDGVYLHSKFDPVGEAQEFAQTCLKESNQGQALIITGLAFGYHLRELLRIDPTLEIFVIEPERNLVESKYNQDVMEKIHLIEGKTPLEICHHPNFILAITKKAKLIKHKASFELNALLYQEINKFNADKNQLNEEWLSPDLADELKFSPEILCQLNQLYSLLERGNLS